MKKDETKWYGLTRRSSGSDESVVVMDRCMIE